MFIKQSKLKTIYKLSLCLSILFVTTISCGKISPEGNIDIQEKKVEDFNNINVEGKFRVFLVNSPNSRVEIETYPNIFENLKIDVKDKTLSISEKREIKNVDFYNITIYSKYNPSKISIADSVEFNVSGEIRSDQVNFHLKNNAKFIGAVNSRKTILEMQDLSLANFKGFTKNAELKIKDTANLLAPYWMIENLKLDSKNGNYAEVNVKDSLKGNVENTARLVYYNDPIRAFKIGKTANVKNKKLE